MPSGVDHVLVPSDAQSTFAWRARDAEGVVCSGTMGAVSADEVAVRLREEGRYVVSIRESASPNFCRALIGERRHCEITETPTEISHLF